MRMDNESVQKVSYALVEMAKNILVDEPFPAYLAVTTICNGCGEFHMYTFAGEKMFSGVTPASLLGAMLFDKSDNDMFISSCKSIGASIASSDKDVIAASFIACATDVDVGDIDMSGKNPEEVHAFIESEMAKGEQSKLKVDPNMTIATYAEPNIYLTIHYKVELLDNNDLVLVDRVERDSRGDGNMYEPLEALTVSASFLKGIQIAVCGKDRPVDTPLSSDNAEKFHSFLYKIEHALEVKDII